MKPVRDTNSEPGLPAAVSGCNCERYLHTCYLKETSGVERFQFHLTNLVPSLYFRVNNTYSGLLMFRTNSGKAVVRITGNI